MPATSTVDGRRLRGERTRAAVLDTAVALASVDGLDGLTLGNLAAAHGVSKSGLFAHWRDKEDLQLAVVERAREQWRDRIVGRALRAPRGVRQLWALHVERLDFYASGVLPGRCFFAITAHEFDDRPGPVRDRIHASIQEWMRMLRNTASEAIAMGELRAGTDPDRLAFEIQALGVGVVAHSRLMPDEQTFTHSRLAVYDRLRSLATDPTILDGVKQ